MNSYFKQNLAQAATQKNKEGKLVIVSGMSGSTNRYNSEILRGRKRFVSRRI